MSWPKGRHSTEESQLALRDKQKYGKEEDDDEKFSKADQRDMMTSVEREAEQRSKKTIPTRKRSLLMSITNPHTEGF